MHFMCTGPTVGAFDRPILPQQALCLSFLARFIATVQHSLNAAGQKWLIEMLFEITALMYLFGIWVCPSGARKLQLNMWVRDFD